MLPYKEEIFIGKNENTGKLQESLSSLGRFGEIIEHNEKYEIKLKIDTKLSDLFKLLEESGVDYNNIAFQNPTLEELFLNLTGRRLRD